MVKTVAIDIREAVSNNPTGKGIFNLRTAQNLIANKDFKWILLCDCSQHIFEDSENVVVKVIKKKGFSWHLATRKYLTKNPVDIYLSPTSYITPFLLRKLPCKKVIVVHDLISFLFPNGHKLKPRILEKLFLPLIVNDAEILTVSSNTKKDLLTLFPHLDQTKINLAYCGVDLENFHPNTNKTANESDEPYILSVSSVIPRKNFGTLIKAFEAIADLIPHKLYIVGSFLKTHSTHKKVKFLNYVPHDKLKDLYSRADLFVYPSLYEGFGIPVVEAFASGCPVICSNTSSLPEVAGDAAITFDPKNSKQLSEIILKVLKDKNLQKDLTEKGLVQAQKFTWEKSAEQITEVLRKL